MAKLLSILLQRSDPRYHWGFSVSGGAELGTPLTISQVVPGTLAAQYLAAGDTILEIEKTETKHLWQEQVEAFITRPGRSLELLVRKGTGTLVTSPCPQEKKSRFFNPSDAAAKSRKQEYWDRATGDRPDYCKETFTRLDGGHGPYKSRPRVDTWKRCQSEERSNSSTFEDMSGGRTRKLSDAGHSSRLRSIWSPTPSDYGKTPTPRGEKLSDDLQGDITFWECTPDHTFSLRSENENIEVKKQNSDFAHEYSSMSSGYASSSQRSNATPTPQSPVDFNDDFRRRTSDIWKDHFRDDQTLFRLENLMTSPTKGLEKIYKSSNISSKTEFKKSTSISEKSYTTNEGTKSYETYEHVNKTKETEKLMKTGEDGKEEVVEKTKKNKEYILGNKDDVNGTPKETKKVVNDFQVVERATGGQQDYCNKTKERSEEVTNSSTPVNFYDNVQQPAGVSECREHSDMKSSAREDVVDLRSMAFSPLLGKDSVRKRWMSSTPIPEDEVLEDGYVYRREEPLKESYFEVDIRSPIEPPIFYPSSQEHLRKEKPTDDRQVHITSWKYTPHQNCDLGSLRREPQNKDVEQKHSYIAQEHSSMSSRDASKSQWSNATPTPQTSVDSRDTFLSKNNDVEQKHSSMSSRDASKSQWSNATRTPQTSVDSRDTFLSKNNDVKQKHSKIAQEHSSMSSRDASKSQWSNATPTPQTSVDSRDTSLFKEQKHSNIAQEHSSMSSRDASKSQWSNATPAPQTSVDYRGTFLPKNNDVEQKHSNIAQENSSMSSRDASKSQWSNTTPAPQFSVGSRVTFLPHNNNVEHKHSTIAQEHSSMSSRDASKSQWSNATPAPQFSVGSRATFLPHNNDVKIKHSNIAEEHSSMPSKSQRSDTPPTPQPTVDSRDTFLRKPSDFIKDRFRDDRTRFCYENLLTTPNKGSEKLWTSSDSSLKPQFQKSIFFNSGKKDSTAEGSGKLWTSPNTSSRPQIQKSIFNREKKDSTAEVAEKLWESPNTSSRPQFQKSIFNIEKKDSTAEGSGKLWTSPNNSSRPQFQKSIFNREKRDFTDEGPKSLPTYDHVNKTYDTPKMAEVTRKNKEQFFLANKENVDGKTKEIKKTVFEGTSFDRQEENYNKDKGAKRRTYAWQRHF